MVPLDRLIIFLLMATLPLQEALYLQIVVPFVIGIITIMVPLLIGQINAIDSKYRATQLNKAFYRETAVRWLGAVIICMIISLAGWVNLVRRLLAG